MIDGNADTCGSVRTEIYMPRGPRTEQRLRKSNPPQEGGLAETSRLAPGVSASFRTYPFLSERHKRDSPQRRERAARDVVRRRWARTTNDMDDLRGQDQDGPALRTATAARNVRTASYVHPRPPDIFEGGRRETAGRGGICLTLVRASTPILYCSDSRQEGENEHNVFSIERMWNRGGRLDAATCETATVKRFSPVHPGSRRVDEGGHDSGEVTL